MATQKPRARTMTPKTHTFENALVQPGPKPTSLVPSRSLCVFGVREKWRQVKAGGDSWEGTRKKEREKGTPFFLAPSHESARALSKLQSPLTLDYEQSPIFPQGQQSVRNASARENHPTREKATRGGEREKIFSLPAACRLFSRVVIFMRARGLHYSQSTLTLKTCCSFENNVLKQEMELTNDITPILAPEVASSPLGAL